MIQTDVKIVKAVCDSCHKTLVDKKSIPGETLLHYAELIPRFGYGHELDNINDGEYHVCGKCWQRVLKLLGLSHGT